MPEEKLQTLSLQVINGSELESGRAARCLFTQQGNVGHGPECHWSVQDRQQSIPAQAFTVILHDGTFCLRPQTAQLWLNQAKVTATSDLIQLRQGDEIQIGRLMVRVHLNRGDIPHYDEEMATPETIVTNRDMLTDISNRHADGSLTLDDDFIPSCQNIQVSKKLRVYLKEVQGPLADGQAIWQTVLALRRRAASRMWRNL